jgi:transposase
VKTLVERVRRTTAASVSLIRVGLEAAGHYHLPLAGGVLPEDWELRVLNPGHVSMQRKVNGQRGVKTDKIDLAAIADLLLAGRGVVAPPFADPVMTLTGWVGSSSASSPTRSGSPGSARRGCGPSPPTAVCA